MDTYSGMWKGKIGWSIDYDDAPNVLVSNDVEAHVIFQDDTKVSIQTDTKVPALADMKMST